MINGSPSEAALLEALQAEVQLAGGSPIVMVSYPKADKRALVEAPVEYLRLPPKGPLALVQAGDVFITATSVADISKRGAVVSQKMQPGQEVRLRSAAGTDLTFRLAASRSRVSTGRAADNDTGTGMASAFFPAGDFYACVDPKSASGVVVQSERMFRGEPTKNVRMTFKDGALTSVTADEGSELLTRFLAALDAPSKQVSLINIGLNPESRPLEGSRYLSWAMGGVPTIGIGNSQWAGCPQGGQTGYPVHQAGATLAVGNVEVVRSGVLVLD